MEVKDIKQLALSVAKKSDCTKRKVGAVIVDINNTILATGYNRHAHGYSCEDENGDTVAEVIHAEVVAIDTLFVAPNNKGMTIYVTHKPCSNCQARIDALDMKVVIVEDFMKFDEDKLRYDLIPPSSTKALAKVLTYGAKKYKPNNWKLGSKDRYVAALMRHIEAYRDGEMTDDDSGLLHLEHAIANVAFLIEMEK